MQMSKFVMKVAVALSLVIGLSACQKQGGSSSGSSSSSNVKLESDEDKTFYTIGVMFGGKLKDLNLSEKEIDLMIKGLKDTSMGKQPEADPAQYQVKVQKLFRDRIKAATDVNKKKGEEFASGFMSKEGGKKLESGLVYKVLNEGKGPKPGPKDTVEVHYHGTLIDGTVFDSSKDRGKTISFPLNRVIKGWTEGLQLVGEGGKVKLVIPSDLGYGDHGAPPKIPGGSTLVFEVELFKVTKAESKEEKKDDKKKK